MGGCLVWKPQALVSADGGQSGWDGGQFSQVRGQGCQLEMGGMAPLGQGGAFASGGVQDSGCLVPE